jgi:hypothetical protein
MVVPNGQTSLRRKLWVRICDDQAMPECHPNQEASDCRLESPACCVASPKAERYECATHILSERAQPDKLLSRDFNYVVIRHAIISHYSATSI